MIKLTLIVALFVLQGCVTSDGRGEVAITISPRAYLDGTNGHTTYAGYMLGNGGGALVFEVPSELTEVHDLELLVAGNLESDLTVYAYSDTEIVPNTITTMLKPGTMSHYSVSLDFAMDGRHWVSLSPSAIDAIVIGKLTLHGI